MWNDEFSHPLTLSPILLVSPLRSTTYELFRISNNEQRTRNVELLSASHPVSSPSGRLGGAISAHSPP